MFDFLIDDIGRELMTDPANISLATFFINFQRFPAAAQSNK
jgi:hypothetical protein